MSAPATAALARHIAEFRANDLPGPVLERTVEVVRDGAGALLAAANPDYSTGRLIADFVRGVGGNEEATVVGFGFKTSTVNAALANGTMGYACDFEPHHPEGILHPIAVTLPTALAVAEKSDASGRNMLAAIALGCEVEYRVSLALGPAQQYHLGFHPSAVCGAFGAAAVAANLLKLNPETTVRALGLAACQASGLMAWEDDPSENARPFQMGMAARNGLTAALLAAQGFGGPDAVFDSGHTIYDAFSRAPNPQKLLDGINRSYDGIMELAIKPYPCVAFLHPALDAVFALTREHDLKPENVVGLEMRFARSGVHCVDGNPLKSHSAQYILAVALARGALDVRDIFIDARENEPVIATLAERITVVADDGELEEKFPEFYATEITIGLRTGETMRRRNDIARGYPELPMDGVGLETKFQSLAGTIASPERIERLWSCLSDLDHADDVHELAALLGTLPDP